jgi:hypothetical protein
MANPRYREGRPHLNCERTENRLETQACYRGLRAITILSGG